MYQERTAGFIDMNAFPDDIDNMAGADVDGRFQFETENPEGELIVVSGRFSFAVE